MIAGLRRLNALSSMYLKRLDEVTALIEKGDTSISIDVELLASAIRKQQVNVS
jgi:hypothetical protein